MRYVQPHTRRAFTLIELLVVVAIITALLAILMPAMHRAIDVAETASCQSNQRQLVVGYSSYTVDNLGGIMQGLPVNVPDGFVYNGAGYDPIKKGALYKYVPEIELFRCPADRNGNERSYSIPGPLRGQGWTNASQKGTDRVSGVVNPAKQIVFVEESDSRGYNQGSWLFPCNAGNEYNWIDYVGLFHAGQTADDFVFLDGHVERRVWEEKNTINAGLTETFYLYDPNNPDWEWVRPLYRQMETRGTVRFISEF